MNLHIQATQNIVLFFIVYILYIYIFLMYLVDQTLEVFCLGSVLFKTEKIMNETVDKLSTTTN